MTAPFRKEGCPPSERVREAARGKIERRDDIRIEEAPTAEVTTALRGTISAEEISY